MKTGELRRLVTWRAKRLVMKLRESHRGIPINTRQRRQTLRLLLILLDISLQEEALCSTSARRLNSWERRIC